MLERLAEKNADRVRIVKVDVRKDRKWAMEQKVRGIPTFQFYRNGMRVEQFAGAYPESYIQSKIDHYAMTMVNEPKKEGEDKSEPTIQPMPQDWLPPGVTRQ